MEASLRFGAEVCRETRNARLCRRAEVKKAAEDNHEEATHKGVPKASRKSGRRKKFKKWITVRIAGFIR